MDENKLLRQELQLQFNIQFVHTHEEASPGRPYVCMSLPAQLSDWLPLYSRGLLAALPADEVEELLPYLAEFLKNPPCERLAPNQPVDHWLQPDFSALDALSGGQLSLRHRMLELYKEVCIEELPKLHAAAAFNQWPAFAQSVHRLKSNFRSLGMTSMQRWCEDLELAAKLRACLPELHQGAGLFHQTLQENLRTFYP